MDAHLGTGTVEQWPVFPQVTGWFSIARLPADTSVFLLIPSSLCSDFPHSFGYFKLPLSCCSFTLAPNLTVSPSVAVKRLQCSGAAASHF